MRFWVQYHNCDKLGYLPGGEEFPSTDISSSNTTHYEIPSITTSKRMILDAIGDVGFFVAGYGGKSKKYFLWSWSIIEWVDELDDGRFDAYGAGRVLNPPQLLTGAEFYEFKKRNANFSLGFRDISNDAYLGRLTALAGSFGSFELLKEYVDALNSVPEAIHQTAGLVEGAVRVVAVNAYERNPEARRRCIEHYGRICCVCGFSFGRAYGAVAEGLIHVHHLRPLSEIRCEYEVDPIEDLRPVCANCHAVLHLRTPAFGIDEVRAFLRAPAIEEAAR